MSESGELWKHQNIKRARKNWSSTFSKILVCEESDTETSNMHRKLGNAALSQLAFPWENNPNFPLDKSQWDNTVKKKN